LEVEYESECLYSARDYRAAGEGGGDGTPALRAKEIDFLEIMSKAATASEKQ
jgi:hypothetical protein